MKPWSKRAPATLAVVALAVLGGLVYWAQRGPAGAPTSEDALPEVAADGPTGSAAEATQVRLPRRVVSVPGEVASDVQEVDQAEPRSVRDVSDRDARFWREEADIEDFKAAIYALEIDTIDDVPKLDALVHVDVEDPNTLWDTDWAGVDDWKRYRDGFTLERAADGTLLFHPGEETQRMFTFFEGISLYEWDESNEAFVNRVDYYGKPIYNVVKFLREDVLVMMTISGHKVDTNIFQQGDYR